MNFIKKNNISILSSDYDNAKDFYTNSLGFKILKEKYDEETNMKRLVLGLEDCEIHIVSRDKKDDLLEDLDFSSPIHLAIEVGNLEDAISELNKKGITTGDIKFDGTISKKYSYFLDPDGLVIELFETSIWEFPSYNQYL